MTVQEGPQPTPLLRSIIRVDGYVFLDRPTLFFLARERSAFESFSKLLSRKQASYQVSCVNENAIGTVPDRLKNTISDHLATLSPVFSHRSDDEPAGRSEHSHKKEPSLNGEWDDYWRWYEKKYASDRIVRLVTAGPRLRYAVQWYGYGKVHDTAEATNHIPRHFIDA